MQQQQAYTVVNTDQRIPQAYEGQSNPVHEVRSSSDLIRALPQLQTEFFPHYPAPMSAPPTTMFNSNYYDQGDGHRYPMSASINPHPNYISGDQSDVQSPYPMHESGADQLAKDCALPRKKRYKPTPDQVIHLMNAFDRDPLPSTASRLDLSSRIDMRPRAIQSNSTTDIY